MGALDASHRTFPQGMWGTVHPRQGHVQQYHDVLAGAVAAQRAVDIATRAGQPHLYFRVPGISESDEKPTVADGSSPERKTVQHVRR